MPLIAINFDMIAAIWANILLHGDVFVSLCMNLVKVSDFDFGAELNSAGIRL